MGAKTLQSMDLWKCKNKLEDHQVQLRICKEFLATLIDTKKDQWVQPKMIWVFEGPQFTEFFEIRIRLFPCRPWLVQNLEECEYEARGSFAISCIKNIQLDASFLNWNMFSDGCVFVWKEKSTKIMSKFWSSESPRETREVWRNTEKLQFGVPFHLMESLDHINLMNQMYMRQLFAFIELLFPFNATGTTKKHDFPSRQSSNAMHH